MHWVGFFIEVKLISYDTYSSFSKFWKILYSTYIFFLSNYVAELPTHAPWIGCFLCGKGFNYAFNFEADNSIPFIYPFFASSPPHSPPSPFLLILFCSFLLLKESSLIYDAPRGSRSGTSKNTADCLSISPQIIPVSFKNLHSESSL